MDDTEYRPIWRSRWLGSIEELSNSDMQRATWLNPANSNPHYNFVEYLCCYFDELSVGQQDGGLAARVSEGLLSKEEAEATSQFHDLFDRYKAPDGDHYDHEAILGDPAWREVVDAANAARQKLSGLITDPEELKYLFEPSPWALEASRK